MPLHIEADTFTTAGRHCIITIEILLAATTLYSRTQWGGCGSNFLFITPIERKQDLVNNSCAKIRGKCSCCRAHIIKEALSE